GLIHRDIKPANVWLEVRPLTPRPPLPPRGEGEPESPPSPLVGEGGRGGEGGRVKILDFGLARSREGAVPPPPGATPSGQGPAGLTQEGTVAGTPHYMAPEQAAAREVDHRSDLFSLGCVLYRMATGTVPFAGATAQAVLRALAGDQPSPPRAHNPE